MKQKESKMEIIKGQHFVVPFLPKPTDNLTKLFMKTQLIATFSLIWQFHKFSCSNFTKNCTFINKCKQVWMHSVYLVQI